jgi:RNA polymerase sigma factor (sigma-70 family)
LLELLESDGSRLYGLLARLSLREGVAEDLMQELFLRLMKSSRWMKAREPAAYVWQMAVRLAFEWRRKAHRAPAAVELLIEPPGDEDPPHMRLLRMEQYDRVLAAASRLRGVLQQVFVMRYVQQMGPEEIARQLRKDPHQVRALCYKALTQIRQLLGGREDADV